MIVAKCSECKRPKVAWVKKVRKLTADLLGTEYYHKNDYDCGKADGRTEAGEQLDNLLKEIES